MVVYESRLELARIMLADFDRSVVAIAAQPLQLTSRYGDRVAGMCRICCWSSAPVL
ncbi:hypothetical protein ABGB07_42440 [Micromonosporaceae bacterium B7E4]